MEEKKSYCELQSKGTHAPTFVIKNPDTKDTSIFSGNQKIRHFNDGERIIVNIVGEFDLLGSKYYKVEDTEGNTSELSAKNFHKITDPKQFSKKFQFFKQANRITD